MDPFIQLISSLFLISTTEIAQKAAHVLVRKQNRFVKEEFQQSQAKWDAYTTHFIGLVSKYRQILLDLKTEYLDSALAQWKIGK